MKSTCPHPGCNTTYDLTNQPRGSRFVCKTCGQTLAVEADGLRLASPIPAPPSPPASANPAEPPVTGAAASPPRPQPVGPLISEETKAQAAAVASDIAVRMRRVADWSTWMFGGGLFLMLCAIFFPLLDRASVSRLEAKIVAGDVAQERQAAALARKKEPTEAEKSRVEKAREAWLDTKFYWEEDLEYAELRRRSNEYWYRWGALVGYGLLILGSFGFLDARQPLTIRIIGCTVLIATALVVLNSLARFSFRLELG
jgi:hypothetical protein